MGFIQMAGTSGGYLAYTTYEYVSAAIHQKNRANSFRKYTIMLYAKVIQT